MMTEQEILQNLKSFEVKKDWPGGKDFLIQNKKSFDTGVYYYNLGIFELQNKDFLNARVAFEKAKINGFESNILNNALSVSKDGLHIGVAQDLSVSDEMGATFFTFSYTFYFSLTLLFLIFILLFLKKIKTNFLRSIFFLLALVPLLFKYFFFPEISAVILKESIPVFEGPSKVFEKKYEIEKGVKVYLRKIEGESWSKLYYPSSVRGWVDNKGDHFIFLNEDL